MSTKGMFSTPGFSYKFNDFINILPNNGIPQCTYDIPHCTHDIPQCTAHPVVYSADIMQDV